MYIYIYIDIYIYIYIYVLEFRPAKAGPPWAMDKYAPIVTAYEQIYANSDSIWTNIRK